MRSAGENIFHLLQVNVYVQPLSVEARALSGPRESDVAGVRVPSPHAERATSDFIRARRVIRAPRGTCARRPRTAFAHARPDARTGAKEMRRRESPRAVRQTRDPLVSLRTTRRRADSRVTRTFNRLFLYPARARAVPPLSVRFGGRISRPSRSARARTVSAAADEKDDDDAVRPAAVLLTATRRRRRRHRPPSVRPFAGVRNARAKRKQTESPSLLAGRRPGHMDTTAAAADPSADGGYASKEVSFDDSNFFETTVEPLLTAGREADLCEWLKKNGLMANEQKCPNDECLTAEKMQWHRARVVDKFNWVCLDCKKKVPARHASFFADFKCELSYALKVVDCWCRNIPLSNVGGEGKTKANVAKRIYNGCAQVAEWQLKKIVGDFKLGGPDVVVIVDVFPDGNMSLEVPTTSHNNNFSRRVLCIADTAHVPVRVWASLLDGSNKENHKIVEMVKNHVMLGSTIVTNKMLYPLLYNLPGIGEVISTEALINLDVNHDQKSLKNLETIWATTVDACIQLQDMSTTNAEQHLYELQWRQMYGFTAFPSIIQQIVEYTAYHNPICPPLPSIWSSN